MASQAGFPPPVLSIAVIERIEPVMLYAAELLPLVPDIYGKLNTLQSSWAKSILADKAGTAIRGVLAVAAVGWSLRLASKAKVRALVYLAKIHLLPPEHPVARMTALAQTLVSGTWLHAVQDVKRQHGDLPLLQDSGVCSQEEVLAARMDRSIRKSILAAYKRHVVAPFFVGLDNKEFQTAAAKHLPSLGVCYSDLCPERLDQGWAGLLRTAPFSLWGAVQLWALFASRDCGRCSCLQDRMTCKIMRPSLAAPCAKRRMPP